MHTETKKEQERATAIELARVKRALKIVTKINETLFRSTSEATLLKTACNIIVNVGGYRFVWIGFAEQDEAKTVRPAAHAGFESEYLHTVNVTWANNEYGQGPTGTAIRIGKTQIVHDILTDPRMTPWRHAAKERGYKSSIALPLFHKKEVFGTLNIYATEIKAFATHEVQILKEIAGDIAFGILSLRAKAEHIHTENEFKIAQRIGHFGSFDWDARTDEILWSDEYYRIYGFKPGTKPPGYTEHLKTYTPETAAQLDAAVKKSMETGKPYTVELEHIRPDGTHKWISAHGEVKRDEQKKIIGLRGTAQDITKQKEAERYIVDLSRFPEENPNIVIRIRPDGTVLFANPPGKKLLKRIDQHVPASLMSDIEKAFKTERLINTELKTNGTFYVVSIVPFKAENYINLYARDITQLKETELVLKEKEGFLEESQEIAGLGSYVLDISKGTWEGSSTLDKLFGINKFHEHTIRGWLEIIHQDDRVAMDTYLRNEVIGRGLPFNKEYRIVRKNDKKNPLGSWFRQIGD